MSRIPDAVMEQRKALLLELVSRASEGGGGARLPSAAAARALGIGKPQAARVARLLEKEGLLVRIPRFAADGAQLANAYELTPKALRRLELGRRDD